jgi:hypothetical protein
MQVTYNERLLKCKAWIKASKMEEAEAFDMFTSATHGSKSAQERVRFRYFLSGKITDEPTLDKFEALIDILLK